MTLPLRVAVLALLVAAPSALSAPGSSAADLESLLGPGVLSSGTRSHDGDDSAPGERVRVESCVAPGPACESDPVRVSTYLRMEVVSGFVGTIHVDVVRDDRPVQRVTCTSTGLGPTACDASPGGLPPGEYVLRSSAEPGTAGTWVVMARYA